MPSIALSRRWKFVFVFAAAAVAITSGVLTVVAESSHGAPSPDRVAGDWTAPDQAKLAALQSKFASEAFEVAVDAEPGLATSSSDYERSILSDGIVTFAEYRAASLAWAACGNEQGIAVHAPRLDGLDRFNKDVLRFDTADEGRRAQTILQACSREFTDAVELVWAGATEPLDKALVKAARDATAACFEAAGYGTTERPWESADGDTQVAYSGCEREVSRELRVVEGFGMTGDGLD
jgi:hypothetical protein